MARRSAGRWLALTIAGVVLATAFRSQGPRVEAGLGGRFSHVSLVDGRGRPTTLRALSGSKALVVAFTGIDCPLANLYLARLAEQR